MIGWLPSMIVGVLTRDYPIYGAASIIITMFLCVISAVYISIHFPPTSFWKSQDEIESLKEELIEKQKLYIDARTKMEKAVFKLEEK
jgi:hypothetical protein